MKKIISVLGCTGSIGLNSLKIVDKKKSFFSVYALSANKNYKLICNQIKKYKPEIFIINNLKVFLKVKNQFKRKKIKILNNFSQVKLKRSDITIAAIPGVAGLKPTIEFTKRSNKILIANKESVICGWDLIKSVAKKNKTNVIPIDSEHFSIMKLMENENYQNIKKIYLTASGGPFLNYKLSKLKKVNPRQAVNHPKWKMGKKISIDSASLMNKLLELVEAQKMFSVNKKKIDIIIHPESLIHAIIEFKNGLVKFIYHETTMLIPLANAIFDDNLNIDDLIENKFNSLKSLNFLKVDRKKFPLIKLKDRLTEYYSTPIIINAANEILVDQFLKENLSFSSFYKTIMKVLKHKNYEKYAIRKPKNINQILEIDQWARLITGKIINL